MGWTNTQAETIVGLAFTYLTTTVLFSTGSSLTIGAGATFTLDSGSTFAMTGVAFDLDATSSFHSDVNLDITSPAGITWDGTLLVDRDNSDIRVGGRPVMLATASFINSFATTDAMGSAVYSDVISAFTTIVKKAGDSGLLVWVNTSSFIAVSASTGVEFGVTSNGGVSTAIVARTFFTTLGEHIPASGFAVLEDGSPPGTYTVQLQWRRYIGTGTIGQNANHDLNCIAVLEG